MNKSNSLLRLIIVILAAVLIVLAIILITGRSSTSEVPDAESTASAGSGLPPSAGTADGNDSSPGDTAVPDSPDLSWEWPVDANGNIVIEPSSNSDIPPDTDEVTVTDTP